MITLFPSLLALVIKIWLLWYGREALPRKRNLLAFLIALFVLNGAELILLILVGSHADPMWVLKIYYVGAVTSVASFAVLANEIAGLQWAWHTRLHLLAGLGLSALFIGTDWIIQGAQELSYTIAREPGVHYWMFQVYALGGLLSALGALAYGMLRAPSNLERKRNAVVLIAVAPTIASSVLIIALMAMGYPMNATVWLSAMIVILLMAIIWSETTEGLFGILSRVPFTREWRTHRKVRDQINSLMVNVSQENGSASLKSYLQEIEGELVRRAYEA
ncbi:MAG: histidine kinase N-terminal 7TM domain-containing protein, partial [Gammaproteobacteria bacterium]